MIDYTWLNEDKQKIAETVGKVAYKTFETVSGYSDPTGTVSYAAGEFAKAAAPFAAGACEAAAATGKKMMENTYYANETEAQKFMREHPLRDAQGNPITAEEGKQKAKEAENATCNKKASENVDECGVVIKDFTTKKQNNTGYSGGIRR